MKAMLDPKRNHKGVARRRIPKRISEGTDRGISGPCAITIIF